MNLLVTLTRRWQLSTQVVAALAIAMLPMGVLAVLLAIQSHAAIGEARPTLAQWLSMTLPVLMWVAALLTAWFAVHRLIVQPLARLRRLIEAYGDSSDPARTQLRMRDAGHDSAEIAILATSFDRMADAIDDHSRDLRDALAEQQRLTREVHHRVKNNLQIVTSLLSLQARAADSPEVVQTYAVIQARIQALTQVHRWMYDDATSHGVDLQALVGDLCAGLETSLISPDHLQVTVTPRVDAIVIHPDVAVPVAFLVTELASLAAQYGDRGPLAMLVNAHEAGGTTIISVAAPGFVGVDRIAAARMVPTARIVHGMARQLRGALVHDPDAGSYSVGFASSPP
jgi:two-component sensor histidine kinase